MIKTFEQYNNQSLLERLKPYLIDGKYMYHYTLTENYDDIREEGLIPKKNPNSFYTDGINGIFLTVSNSLYQANLPETLMDLMDDYYNNEDEYEYKPIIRLKIDVSKLDMDKIIWDDDYILNKYGWNKATDKIDKIIESIDIWGSIAYQGLISPEYIINSDFDYHI